jgi:hypothetical protein
MNLEYAQITCVAAEAGYQVKKFLCWPDNGLRLSRAGGLDYVIYTSLRGEYLIGFQQPDTDTHEKFVVQKAYVDLADALEFIRGS